MSPQSFFPLEVVQAHYKRHITGILPSIATHNFYEKLWVNLQRWIAI